MSGALAVVQARMSSSRLPGKTLADIDGDPMLALLLSRLGRAERVARIVVATSDGDDDDPIVPVAQLGGAEVHRGALDDVLGRFVSALGDWDGPVVRITADCPLTDPAVVDDVIELWQATPGLTYASNLDPRVHPDGLDVEVIDAEALREVAGEVTDPIEREHVTMAVRSDPVRFPAAGLRGDERLAGLRWTVDVPEDLAFVRRLACRLGDARRSATCAEILDAVRADEHLRAQPGRAWPVDTVNRR